MGWYFTDGASRRDVIKEITDSWESEHTRSTTLRKFTSGNTLWTVQEQTRKSDGATERFIGCYLLQRSRDGWGYKPMDESMGPCEVTCPLAFLDMVPDPGGFATEWRVKVRAYHARTGRKLSVGQTVRLTNGREAQITSVRPLRGVVGGTLYRIPRRMLAEVK